MSEIIQICILVTLLKSQNMKNIIIYFKVNLFLSSIYFLCIQNYLLKINCHHYVYFIFTITRIHDTRLQNNNFTYIYVENNHSIPHNLIYIKRIYYEYILTAQLKILECIYDTLYENLTFYQLIHVHYDIFLQHICIAEINLRLFFTGSV